MGDPSPTPVPLWTGWHTLGELLVLFAALFALPALFWGLA
jgi:hypothetical protein